MDLSLFGLRFLARREALVLVAYPDGRFYSIGFGYNDRSLKEGDTITVKRAFELLREAITPRAAEVSRKLKVEVTQQQFDALVSCYYQSGNKFINEVIAQINHGKPRDAGILLVNHYLADTDSTGTHRKDLRRRRQHEQRLYFFNDYGILSPIPVWHRAVFDKLGHPRPPDEWMKVTASDFV